VITRSRLVRGAAGAFVAGTVLVGAAWAGVGLAPVSAPSGPLDDLLPGVGDLLPAPSPQAEAAAAALGEGDGPPSLDGLERLAPGELLVGAAVTSLDPDPDRWQTGGCSEYVSNFPEEVTHLAGDLLEHQTLTWPRSPDCIYLGGYGIGPARAATSVDPHAGVNVRSLAISNGEQTILWQTVDLVGYFAKYRDDLCGDCGILDVRRRISDEVGIPVANVAVGSTHTHGGADGYGAWGGLPDWYRAQVRDQIVASAYDALRAMRPAAVEIGSVEARAFNSQRRDTYWSTADYGAVWLQARALGGDTGGDGDGGAGGGPGRGKGKGGGSQPAPEPPAPEPGEVIATLVNYAAHPVVLGAQPVMHGDWPATASKALGDQLGGVGLVMEGGLGNVSPSRPTERGQDLTGDATYDQYDRVIEMGEDFAAFIGGDIARGGHRLVDNEIVAVTETIEHPVTNWLEAGLGVAGLLDRDFLPGDAAGAAGTYRWSKGGDQAQLRSCATAAPLTIKTEVSGYRVGDLVVLTGPGELFSNMSQVVKSRARRNALGGGQAMVFAQMQDSLGYIIQSFEVDDAGGVTTYAGVAEYEETFMLDRCFGDHVLDTQLAIIPRLG
jgi:hypothetical protein